MTTDRPNATERDQMRADGILCTMCLYYGLNHDGDHWVTGAERWVPES